MLFSGKYFIDGIDTIPVDIHTTAHLAKVEESIK